MPCEGSDEPDGLPGALLGWYQRDARDLPWRRPDASPWGVLVSEFMLQQTPVARVLSAYRAWLARWPAPGDLAAEPPGEAVRQWGNLGYPRRALRLHSSARAIAERHDGEVPSSYDELRALPGVGSYTAAAVAAFAYGRHHAVLDTNVRRVLGRLILGVEYPAPSQTAAERRIADSLLPRDASTAARWSVAVMELGALVCTARSPRCSDCPVAQHCAWRLAGRPPYNGAQRRRQRYDGTDRQARGRLLAVLRGADKPVGADQLTQAWDDPVQRARALDGLIADGLAEPLSDGRYALPR